VLGDRARRKTGESRDAALSCIDIAVATSTTDPMIWLFSTKIT
jgi:hypothetical protein